MKFITVTELRLRATQVVSEIVKTKKEIIVTKNGKPAIQPMSTIQKLYNPIKNELAVNA